MYHTDFTCATLRRSPLGSRTVREEREQELPTFGEQQSTSTPSVCFKASSSFPQVRTHSRPISYLFTSGQCIWRSATPGSGRFKEKRALLKRMTLQELALPTASSNPPCEGGCNLTSLSARMKLRNPSDSAEKCEFQIQYSFKCFKLLEVIANVYLSAIYPFTHICSKYGLNLQCLKLLFKN